MRHDEPMNVRLVISEEMTKRGNQEHTFIRIPKRARLFFSASGKRIELRVKGESCDALEIKQAYKDDIKRLLDELRDKKITEDQVQATGFITRKVFNRIKNQGNLTKDSDIHQHCYITDGVSSLMIGADPEFCIVDPVTKTFLYAEQLPMPGRESLLGSDGPLAEVRPPPSTEVSGLVENIASIFKSHSKPIDKYLWIGGAAYHSPDSDVRVPHIGGHIHIGNPKLLVENVKLATHQRIIQILDETVALPLVRIDGPSPHLRRNSAKKYGKYGDQREQEGRFEWRVPSGLWLVHPTLSQAVLGATKAVSEHCYQMIADQGFSNDWISAPGNRKGLLKSWGIMDSRNVERMVNAAQPEKITDDILNRSKTKLQNLSTYDKYRNEIEEFVRVINLSEADRANINLDVKNSWLENGPLIKSH